MNLFLNLKPATTSALLKEAGRVCKKKGRVICDFRSSRNLFFVLKYKFVRLYDDTAPYPLYTYSPAEVGALLRGAGLRAVSERRIGFGAGYFAPIMIIEAEKL